MMEESRLRMFGPERNEVTGYWKRSHNAKVIELCFSPDLSG
jgi:hypothetical protein